MKRGEQKTCPAHTAYRQQAHLIGGLDWATDQVHVLPVDRKNSTTFSAFLEWLCLDIYPDQPLILVLDNASYHHSANVMALVALLQPRFQVLWLPTYSPDMNPIEPFWLHLKHAVYANCLFASLAHLLEHIQLWLGFQNLLYHPNHFSFSKSFR